jgi:two-component system sensor histidine kinase AlgZ
MTTTSGREPGRSGDIPGPEFFLPDLCATRPVVIMILLAELLVVVHVLGDSRLPVFDWKNLALASLFVQWIVLLSAALLCAARQLLLKLSLLPGVAVSFGIILLVTTLSSLVAFHLLRAGTTTTLDGWWLLRNLLMAGVIGGIVLRYFYLQQQLRLREQAELTARIESLRSRIRPHFLFNTMNSIASLIGSRPDEAERVVEDLSELFRASLSDDQDGTTLADELHLCKSYLRIEQLRLGERLRLRWSLDHAAQECPFPALLLQPLVENAVYHGVARIAEGGEIVITTRCLREAVVVTITNPVTEVSAEDVDGHHMALDNIRQRLEVHYEGRAVLELCRSGANHEVALTIPWHRATNS